MERTIEQIKDVISRIENNIRQEKKQIDELRKEMAELVQREFENKYNIKSGDKITITETCRLWGSKIQTKVFDIFYIGFVSESFFVYMVYADVKKDGTLSKNTHKGDFSNCKIKKAE